MTLNQHHLHKEVSRSRASLVTYHITPGVTFSVHIHKSSSRERRYSVDTCSSFSSSTTDANTMLPSISPTRSCKFYDTNGKVTTPEYRRNSLQRIGNTIFDRMVTSTELRQIYSNSPDKRPSFDSNSDFRTRPQTAHVHNDQELNTAMRNFAKKVVRAKSAKGRTYFNPNHVSSQQEGFTSSGYLLLPRRRTSSSSSRRSSRSKLGNADVEDTELQINIGTEKIKTDHNEDDCSSCSFESYYSSSVSNAETEKKIVPGGAVKLKIGMAEFTRRMEENEGTNISTFSYQDDIENKIAPAVDEQKFKIEEKKSVEIPVSAIDVPDAPVIPKTSKEPKVKKRRKKLKMTSGDKFRRAVKTINLLIKACTTKADQTRKNQMRLMTFSDITDNVAEERGPQSLDFQVSYFKARKEMTLSAEAKDCLRLHTSMRTPEMQHAALVSLQATVEVFSEFPIQMQQSLVKVGWYEKFDSKRIIIRQGHNALNYYFIISGTTVVSVATKNSSGETMNRTLAFLKKGHSFGELALMYGGKRSATVYCKDEVELLAVNREDFIDIFMNLNAEEEPEHIQFLRKIHLMKGWPLETLPYDNPKICMFTYFRRGTVLCRDSNNNDWIYIIKTGTCRIIKEISSASANLLKLKTKKRLCEHIPIANTENGQYLEFLQKDCLPIRESSFTSRSAVSSAVTQKKTVAKPNIFIQLKILTAKDVFGLEPIAFEIFGGTTSVCLVSDGTECILIRRDFFLKHINERYYKKLREEIQPFPTLESLDEKLQAHCNWNAYKESLVDFLKYNETIQL